MATYLLQTYLTVSQLVSDTLGTHEAESAAARVQQSSWDVAPARFRCILRISCTFSMSTENVEHDGGRGTKSAEGRIWKARERHVHGGALSLVNLGKEWSQLLGKP